MISLITDSFYGTIIHFTCFCFCFCQIQPGQALTLSNSAKPDKVIASAEKELLTEEILNCILPPKEWEENGELWRQQVGLLLIKLNSFSKIYMFIYRINYGDIWIGFQ